jgi:hypothetical protein
VHELHGYATLTRTISMVSRDPVTFDQFLRAVHRRHVALRIIERAGAGLVIACALATVFVAVVLWRGGNDAWSLAGFALATGAVVGAVAGAVNRPSALDAACEADRQLETSDLLATALTLNTRGDANDPWADTVLALAAERCRRHTPREVVLRRLGVRAWGGILLAVAFVGVLTALSSTSREAVAAGAAGDDAAARGQRASRATRQPIIELTDVTQAPPRQRRAELSPDDSPSSTSAADAADAAAAAASSDRTPAAAADTQPDARDVGASSPNASSPSAGESQATSANPRTPDAGRPKLSERTGAVEDTTRPRDDASPSAGVGRAARSNGVGTDAVTGGDVITQIDRNPTRSAPPWSSSTWPQTVESAEQQVRSGRVPDDVRDLVRGYFDPAASGR